MTVVTDQNFESEVLGHTGATLVEFHSNSKACQKFQPVMSKLTKRLGDQARCIRVDASMAIRAAREYGIRATPALVVFHNGKVVQIIQGGGNDVQKMVDLIRPYL